jgi:hypothetical protein
MRFIIVFILFFSLKIYSQDFLIRVSNEYPAIGEKVQISFNFLFLDETLRNNLGEDFYIDDEWFDRNKDFNSGLPFNFNGFEKRTVIPKKFGEYQIGPFEFIADGKKYISNSVIIHVGKTKVTNEELKFSFYSSGNSGTLRILFKGKINGDSQTFIENQFPAIKEGLQDIKTEVSEMSITSAGEGIAFLESHKIERVYKINNLSDKEIIIDDDFFDNLPLNYVLPEMILKPSEN